MIQVTSISKHYKDTKRGLVKAVDEVSIECRAGEIVGLLGRNGAGKSTLLRMLSTVIKPTAGSASISGLDVVANPEAVRRQIGFMSTSTALYGRLSPREMLVYFGGLYGLEGSFLKDRVEQVIAEFQISDYADGMCDKLSTGQKQRVNIARTILHDPPVLFFDEPTSGLDIVMSQDVMRFVERARTQGKTVVYCTHIMSEVERLCDRVYVIHEGTLRGTGTVASLQAETGEASLEKAFLKLLNYQPEVLA